MIIGIDGYIGAGKDTVADILVKEGFTKVAFADELRRSASSAFDIDINTFIDRNLKDKEFDTPRCLTPKELCDFCDYLGYEHKCDEVVLKFSNIEILSPRHLLKFLGTELGRETLTQTLWLDKYQDNIKGIRYVVTPDARFSNERELISNLEGINMFVERKEAQPSGAHKSENDKWPLDKYDVVVNNDGDQMDLLWGVRSWSREWKRR